MLIYILIITIIFVAVFAVDIFIQMVLNRLLKLETEKELRQQIESGMTHVGRYIGWTERLFILAMIVTGYYEGIGFVLAAKSLLRMGDLSSGQVGRKFSEYVILGTLLSFSMAFILGMIVRYLLKLPIQL